MYKLYLYCIWCHFDPYTFLHIATTALETILLPMQIFLAGSFTLGKFHIKSSTYIELILHVIFNISCLLKIRTRLSLIFYKGSYV